MKHEQVDIEKLRAQIGEWMDGAIARDKVKVGGVRVVDIEAALDELAALRERGRWRPIESAPKDGTLIDVCIQGIADSVGEANFLDGRWITRDGQHRALTWYVGSGPTHWRPRPEPLPLPEAPR